MKNESPKYRFDKFDENWFLVRISNIASQFKTGGTPSTKEPNFWGGTIPWIQSSDIQKDTLFGVIPQKFISEEGLQNSSAKLIPKSSIAIVTRVGVGKLAIIEQDYTTSQDFLSLSDLNGDIQFLVYSIYRMLQKESTQLQGTSIKGITKEELLSKKISLPDIKEQSAIGSLFRTLDDLLASYKDNLANYQSIRANMLSKMFPKVGQTVPEIRLDGFEGEWKSDTFESYLTESRILGDSGLDAKKITVKLWGKGVVEKEEKYAGSSNTQYYIRKAGQFIYSKLDFQNQAFGIVPTELDGYQSTLDLPTFDVKGIDTKFLLEYVMRREFYEYQGLIANGSRKAKRIHPDDFLSMPVRIPSLAEQQAIGDYFSNLDQLITSYQEKITQLETLKKKLLQDMFI
ncbi:restriction endonuclease subunit S [Streptococcus vestibularis]|uniref:Restriction endonuclease subunit S n=1 Tax=Streptococcus vestibularis TaxID=1343 RepID=A0AAW7QGJ9_STRVE|nr:restriction endonuclease subunit S [Streptococcus vestibularis]MDN5268883.1 restriction endonuclease subunit S [Streptococcus vestibularis]